MLQKKYIEKIEIYINNNNNSLRYEEKKKRREVRRKEIDARVKSI